MPDVTMNLDVEDLHDHSMLFFDSYGRLMAEWAAIRLVRRHYRHDGRNGSLDLLFRAKF